MKDWVNLEPDKYRLINKNFTRGRGGHRIRKIVRHHNAGILTTEGCWQVWQTREASAHYQVEVDGTIGQLVNDWDTAWHAANATVNAESIGIEHANCGGQAAGWPISEATIREGGKLAGALCHVYKLGRPTYGVNVFDHRDFHGTSCPHHLAHGGKYDRAWFEAAWEMYVRLEHGECPQPAPQPKQEKGLSMQAEKTLGLIMDQLAGPGRHPDGTPAFNGWDEHSICEAARTREGGGKTMIELVALTREDVARQQQQLDTLTQAVDKLTNALTKEANRA